MSVADFETSSLRMERFLVVQVFAPTEDVDRIMEHVCQIVPLVQGAYDRNAFQSASGIERYRPLDGAAAGAETELRKRPGVVCVTFDVPDDRSVLENVVEAIYQVHSYQEPVIKIHEALISRTKGIDDKNNPYRWWNAGGDWKQTVSDAKR
jgi:hypothetical protein